MRRAPLAAVAAVLLASFPEATLRAQAPAAVSPLKKISDIVIYRNDDFHCAFPSLVVRPDGEILCAFRRAPSRKKLWGAKADTHTDPNSYLMMVRSKDNGATWSKDPDLIFAHPLGGSQDPCMLQLADGSILCASYGWVSLPEETLQKMPETTLRHTGFAFLGGYVLRSDDGARTWKGPFIPPALPGEAGTDALGHPSPTFNRGQPVQLPDGSIAWAVVRADQIQPKRRSSVHLIRSTDRGETWNYVAPVAVDDTITFNETSLVQTAKGDLLAFMRTDNFEGKLAWARSNDGGKTFAPWKDGVLFGHPFQGLRLPDGRILLVYGHRRPPFGIRAKLLNPEATDVAEAPEIVLRDDGGGFDIGYTWAARLPDGRILVAYYINLGDGPRHIAASFLKIDD